MNALQQSRLRERRMVAVNRKQDQTIESLRERIRDNRKAYEVMKKTLLMIALDANDPKLLAEMALFLAENET